MRFRVVYILRLQRNVKFRPWTFIFLFNVCFQLLGMCTILDKISRNRRGLVNFQISGVCDLRVLQQKLNKEAIMYYLEVSPVENNGAHACEDMHRTERYIRQSKHTYKNKMVQNQDNSGSEFDVFNTHTKMPLLNDPRSSSQFLE